MLHFANFNTSYVVIKPMFLVESVSAVVYFNTSYVVIKPDWLGGAFGGITFQYILCCY